MFIIWAIYKTDFLLLYVKTEDFPGDADTKEHSKAKIKNIIRQKYFLSLFSLNCSRPKTTLRDYVLSFITSGFSSCSVKRVCWVKHYSPPADAFFHIHLDLFLLVHFQSALSISHLRTLLPVSPFLSCSIQTSPFSLFCHVFYFLLSLALSLLQLSPFPSYSSLPHLQSYSPIPSLLSSTSCTCLLFRSGLWRLLALCCAQETFTDIGNILISSRQVGTIFVSCRHRLLSAP